MKPEIGEPVAGSQSDDVSSQETVIRLDQLSNYYDDADNDISPMLPGMPEDEPQAYTVRSDAIPATHATPYPRVYGTYGRPETD